MPAIDTAQAKATVTKETLEAMERIINDASGHLGDHKTSQPESFSSCIILSIDL